MDQPERPIFAFATAEAADEFRKEIADRSLRLARPIYWHDNALPFPKQMTGATCFFLQFQDRYIGVTAAHVVRAFLQTKASTPELVCQLHLIHFDLEGALIDIDDKLDIATFAMTEKDINQSLSEAFDVSASWPAEDVLKQGAAVYLVGYPENIRLIDAAERSAIFQAWGAFEVVADFTGDEIIVVYEPGKVIGAPTKPPLGYNMSGCSGGPAVIHFDRNGLHRWEPIGLIMAGPREGHGEAAEFDMIRVRRIDCIEPDGRLRRSADTGWLPS